MAIRVYVVKDSTAISFIEENDIDGFRNYLLEEDYISFGEPEEFESESEALAFCAGLGYGVEDHNPVERLSLRSFEEYDRPFIEAIESY